MQENPATPAAVSLGTPVALASPQAPLRAAGHGYQERTLSTETSTALRNFVEQHAVTFAGLVHGAWALLLSRYSREEEIQFGSMAQEHFASHANGHAEILTQLAFTPTLARVWVQSETSVRSWLQNLESQLADFRESTSSPTPTGLTQNGQAEGVALFESVVIIEQTRSEGRLTARRNDTVDSDYIKPITAHSALTIVAVYGQEVSLRVDYDASRFDGDAMMRLLGHLETLLTEMVAKAEQPLAHVSLVTVAERQQLVAEWNDTRLDYPHDQCLHDLVEAQVARTPDTVAVVYDKKQISYRELNERANRLAYHLQSQGVGPEVVVGVCLERSIEMVVGLLAILKAGGAYVALDPAYPAERLAFMLEDSQALVLITERRQLGRLPEHAIATIYVDEDQQILTQGNGENPTRVVAPSNLAYVIYTSGSTGKPKGVAIRHCNVCAFVYWAQSVFSREQLAGVVASTSICFDLSVFELFVPLSRGGCIVLVKDVLQLPHLTSAQEVTLINTVPSAIIELLRLGGIPPSVKIVNLAGEPLPTRVVTQLYELGTVQRVFDLYGPSETTTYSTYVLRQANEPPTIGRPLGNTQIYLLDAHGHLAPVGVAGEIYIGGAGVARGYLNRPELTAEKFVHDSFSAEPGARLYRTGDLARYRPDGNLEFLGRIDQQVKVRGYRIELGEVEAVISRHAAVREAVVVARDDDRGAKHLVAYVVPSHEPSPSVSELRSHMSGRLPEYMLPSAFVFLPALPLTPNGKVDRKALPAPTTVRPQIDQRYAAPRTDLERYLADLWCQILKVDAIGIHDKFFEVGGNSLLGAMLINNIRQKLGEVIFIVTLFEAPTIAQFAVYLRTHYGDAVTRVFGASSATTGKSLTSTTRRGETMPITAADVAMIRPLFPSFEQHIKGDPTNPKNPRALFILATHRSGTTLLRVMLAGHPQLFAVPELQLLGFATLQGRRAAFTGKYNLWLEGTMRALMEIEHCGPEEAKRTMSRYEDRGLTTKDFFHVLQERIGPRILVDKTPSYVLDPLALQRAEEYFDQPLYIHLVRHPYAMVRSFEGFHLNQVLLTGEHGYSARQFAELVWTVSHQNILEFLSHVPRERQYRMKFEDLTSGPQAIMEEMCATLGLPYHSDLIQPYKDTDKKIMDGIYADSTPMGDPKFHEHGKIDRSIGETWRNVSHDDFLGDVTWEVAESLGYERPTKQQQGTEQDSSTSAVTLDHRRALQQRQRELRQSRRATRTER